MPVSCDGSSGTGSECGLKNRQGNPFFRRKQDLVFFLFSFLLMHTMCVLMFAVHLNDWQSPKKSLFRTLLPLLWKGFSCSGRHKTLVQYGVFRQESAGCRPCSPVISASGLGV